MEKTNSIFYKHYQSIYGSRWPALYDALLQAEVQVARINQFAQAGADLNPSSAQKYVQTPEFKSSHYAKLNALSVSESQPISRQGPEELLDLYIMDPASIYAAKALEVQPGDKVLDMCAAPGGKSLVLAEALFLQNLEGELILNDMSDERRQRLIKVIQQYVPRSTRDHVWVYGKDAVQYGLKDPGRFDRVLLDAPCSGERHLLENEKAFAEWSPRRTEHLAIRQYSILCAALLAVREGGRIVYSTCSISPEENDLVLKKLFKKKKGQVQLVEPSDLDLSIAEKTEYGWQFLPDRCGFGPIYFASIAKI